MIKGKTTCLIVVYQLWTKIPYLFRCGVELSSEFCPRKTLYLCPSINWTCQPAICTCSVPSDIQQPEISDTGKRLWTGHVGRFIMSPSNRLTSGSNGYLPWFVQTGTQTGTCRVPPQPQLAPDGRQRRERKVPRAQTNHETTWENLFLLLLFLTSLAAGRSLQIPTFAKCAVWSHVLHIESDK